MNQNNHHFQHQKLLLRKRSNTTQTILLVVLITIIGYATIKNAYHSLTIQVVVHDDYISHDSSSFPSSRIDEVRITNHNNNNNKKKKTVTNRTQNKSFSVHIDEVRITNNNNNNKTVPAPTKPFTNRPQNESSKEEYSVVHEIDNKQGNDSLNCRLEWDIQRKQILINRWLQSELPILISAIRHRREEDKTITMNGDSGSRGGGRKIRTPPTTTPTTDYYRYTKHDIVYIIFTQRPHQQKQTNKIRNYRHVDWMCLYDDDEKEEELLFLGETADVVGTKNKVYQKEPAMIAPYVNGKGDEVILMCNFTTTKMVMINNNNSSTTKKMIELVGVVPLSIESTTATLGTELYNTDATDTTKNTIIYDITKPLQCDRLEEEETSKIHSKNTIGACLRFRGEFDRRRIPEFIEYHRLIGVEHFWVYMNEEWNMTGLYERSYITYVPFDITWSNHKQYFLPYHYTDVKPVLSQEPANWQCMYNARKYMYDWIITTDVDEYIYVPKKENGTTTVTTTDIVLPPLQSYLKQYNLNHYSSLVMYSIPFGSNNFLESNNDDIRSENENRSSSSSLMIDYVWRRNWNLSQYELYRQKQIYNPGTVWSFGVHYCWVADGAKNVVLYSDDGLFLQHYKLAHKGVYKKFNKLMIKSPDDLRIDTKMRDDYREDLVLAIEQLRL